MSLQLDLEFESDAKAPVVTASEIAMMIGLLRGKDWQTAAQLGATSEKDKRSLRAIAEAADPQIISGQRGYKLTIEATPKDMESFAWLKRQAKKNMGRYIRTVRFWHRNAHPQPA